MAFSHALHEVNPGLVRSPQCRNNPPTELRSQVWRGCCSSAYAGATPTSAITTAATADSTPASRPVRRHPRREVPNLLMSRLFPATLPRLAPPRRPQRDATHAGAGLITMNAIYRNRSVSAHTALARALSAAWKPVTASRTRLYGRQNPAAPRTAPRTAARAAVRTGG